MDERVRSLPSTSSSAPVAAVPVGQSTRRAATANEAAAGISDRGFLPQEDPLTRLPAQFEPWEELGHELPRLLVSGRVRNRVVSLPDLDVSSLVDAGEERRAMLLLSFIGHAYVWGEAQPAQSIPSCLACPWFEVARRLGRPPVLSYASYALDNFRRLDPAGPVALGNLALCQHFLGGADEEWFITVHIDIEAKAAPALGVLYSAQHAAKLGELAELETHLWTLARSAERMCASLARMGEWCDPYIYYTRVRPFIFGWKNQPALPNGLIYEGVDDYAGKPQQLRGETGAQSSIVPAIDAVLGIEHQPDPLREYLMEMRAYMPPEHRSFIEGLEAEPCVRAAVEAEKGTYPALREAYNTCVYFMQEFRSKHLELAARYIHQQSQRSLANPTEVGTGGTPFMRYLKKHRDETTGHHLDQSSGTRSA